MKSYTLVAVALAAVTVNAQFGDLPACVFPCVSSVPSTCGLLDVKCRCLDAAYQVESAKCFKIQCTAPGDYEKALTAGAALCESQGVPVTPPPGEEIPEPEPTPEPTPVPSDEPEETPEPTEEPEPTDEEPEETPSPTPAPEPTEEPEDPEEPETTEETTLVTVTKCPPTTTAVVIPPPVNNGTNGTAPPPVIPPPTDSAAGALQISSLLLVGVIAAVFSL